MDMAIAEKKNIYKSRSPLISLVHLGFVFFFIFSAFMALQGIESSLNFENGIGTLSLSLLYGTNFISAIIIGPPLVHILTPKWAMFTCFLAHTFFIVAHFWSVWQLLVIASFILGVAFSPAWIGNGTFITVLANRHAGNSNKPIDTILQLFNSVFYMMFSLSGVPGNIASSLILRTQDNSCENGDFWETPILSDEGSTSGLSSNFTTQQTESISPQCVPRNLKVCGPNHCPYIKSHTDVLEVPSPDMVFTLLACFLGMNMIGIGLCAVLPGSVRTDSKIHCKTLLSTCQILKRKQMRLFVVPLFVVFVNDSLFYGSFTQSFVSCTYGIEKVGFAALSQAAGFFVITIIFGSFSKAVAQKRQIIVAATIMANGALALTWLLWQPTEDTFWQVLFLSGTHGVVHGIYKVQFGAMTSMLFPDDPEAAFSIYNLTFTAATSFTFGISFILCFYVKMYIFIALLTLMAIFYSILEFSLRKQNTFELEKLQTFSQSQVKNCVIQPSCL